MKNIQLNLTQISSIIEGLETSIQLYEMKKKKYRSKFDKQWADNMITKYTDSLITMSALKQEFEQKIINDHQKHSYSIYPMFGNN